MALPSYLVEISFGSSGYIDVTQYIQSVSISRGINRALDDYSAGSVSVTFVNNSRVFDPLNTSSPLWYGAGGYSVVQPAGRIRITSNSVRRFTGYVENWEFSFEEAGKDATATVTGYDLIGEISASEFISQPSDGVSSTDPYFGVQPVVQTTGDRIDRVFNFNGYGASQYALVESGKTIVGADTNTSGESILTYMQNLAQSEPADFFANASAVMVLKDRNFTNYTWANTTRNNLIVYPGTATGNIGENVVAPLGYMGWYEGDSNTSSTPLYAGGSVNQATVNSTFSRYEMRFYEISASKYNPDESSSNDYVFSAWFKGEGLRSVNGGITVTLDVLDSLGNTLQSNSTSGTAIDGATWKQFTFTNNYSGTAFAGVDIRAYSAGTASSNYFIANGWQLEKSGSLLDYFDGTYNPYASAGATVVSVGWSAEAYKSYSGLVTSVGSTATGKDTRTFADANSQGTAYGNGTGIPFTDLQVTYASENLYNQIEVIGVNATATVIDSVSQSLYGLRTYAQTNNLTTSVTRPEEIAVAFRGDYRLPEYRAEKLSVALESLTTAEQTIVLGIEIRDVIRVCFQPSTTGAIVDKYYQVLGVSSNTDVERDEVTLSLASLDNLAFRLDSPFLGILNTDTLG